MDDTRIDAAPTPAHIFAYRAFRSAFVGSPGSSPVRPDPITSNNNNDKENAQHHVVRGSRFATSPVKVKRDAETDHVSLTPKRQRTNPVSPTKSILKNPNVLTPRRAGLRDVTVTFKDVRLSMSPEAACQVSPTRIRSQPDLRRTLESLSLTTAPRHVSTSQIEALTKDLKPAAPLQSGQDFDLDAYIAQTEKEMRRLIKYGQKWREYARKQEEENTRLRNLIEETRKENERLRQVGNKHTNAALRPQSSNFSFQPPIEAQITKRPHDQSSYAKPLDKKTCKPESEKWKIPLETSVDVESHQKSHHLHTQEPISRHKTERSEEKSREQARTDTEAEKRSQPISQAKSSGLAKVNDRHLHSDAAFQFQRQLEDQPSTDKGGRLEDDQDIAPAKTVASAPAMTEEQRKAAARERLRLRRESKAGGLKSGGHAVGITKSARAGQARLPSVENDESQVDWMAIV